MDNNANYAYAKVQGADATSFKVVVGRASIDAMDDMHSYADGIATSSSQL
jgi:hypothetical protein